MALDLKKKLAMGEPRPLLAGKNLGMLFFYSSKRTRISFETGMPQLGGHAQYYSITGCARRWRWRFPGESWVDNAKVLSRYLDGVVCRIFPNPASASLWDLKCGEAHNILEITADNSTIPVINAA